MAIIRQFAAVLKKNRNSRVISSRLPLEIALFALKHGKKLIPNICYRYFTMPTATQLLYLKINCNWCYAHIF